MKSELKIIFNENCPICSFEINHYKHYALKKKLPIKFVDLNTTDLSEWGVTKDQAAKQLIAIKDGKTLKGIEAFKILWNSMPRYKLLAVMVKLPIVNQLSDILYNFILAPAIYKMHIKRELKKNN